ncbi:MAG: hypothetical protein ABII07_00290 [Patescibacteria group bacterium]|nr:hypothetical protein [Patescibacteria group bacterium]
MENGVLSRHLEGVANDDAREPSGIVPWMKENMGTYRRTRYSVERVQRRSKEEQMNMKSVDIMRVLNLIDHLVQSRSGFQKVLTKITQKWSDYPSTFGVDFGDFEYPRVSSIDWDSPLFKVLQAGIKDALTFRKGDSLEDKVYCLKNVWSSLDVKSGTEANFLKGIFKTVFGKMIKDGLVAGVKTIDGVSDGRFKKICDIVESHSDLQHAVASFDMDFLLKNPDIKALMIGILRRQRPAHSEFEKQCYQYWLQSYVVRIFDQYVEVSFTDKDSLRGKDFSPVLQCM